MGNGRGGARVASAQDTRQHNLSAVLQVIYREPEPSRADIARFTGLTRPTVSSLVAELIEAGVVTELGVGVSAGGKPPTILGVRPEARSIVALDLSREPLRGAVADLTGALSTHVVRDNGGAVGSDALDRVLELVHELVAAAPSPVIGIGIASPGLVDAEGTVIEASNLGWHGLPLAELVGTATGLPVWVRNDADAAAFAVMATTDDDGGPQDLLALRIGHGLGAGVILSGELRHGAASAAGEIGHVVVDPTGPACSCGNAGCLETVASVRAIRRAAAGPAAGTPGDVSPDALGAATAGAAGALAGALAPVVGLLDVERIVLDCELPDRGASLAADLQAELRRRLIPAVAERVTVEVCRLGDDLVVTGVAAIALREAMGVLWR